MSRKIIVLIILVIIVFICFIISFYQHNRKIAKIFSNQQYSFDTGSGLYKFAFIRVKASHGSCKLILSNRYTGKVEDEWIISSKKSLFRIIYSKSKSYTLTIYEGGCNDDFVVTITNFVKKQI